MGLLSRLFEPDARHTTQAVVAAAAGATPRDAVPELVKRCQELVLEINRSAATVPGIGVVLARAVTDTIGAVLRAPDAERLDISVRVAIHGILTDYLPGAIRAYVGAARAASLSGMSAGSAGAAGPEIETATDALVDQLTTLRRSVEQLAQASRDRDLQALQVHGRFLEDKFGGSELDL